MPHSGKDRLTSRSNRHHAFNDSDNSDDDAQSTHARSSSRREEIVSFGREGAKGRRASPPPVAPRVIPVTSNLDWRQDRRERLGMAANLQSLGPLVSMRRNDSSAVPGSSNNSNGNATTNADAINTEAQKSGLELRKSKPRAESTPDTSSIEVPTEQMPDAGNQEAGTDQEAIQALLAGEGVGGSSSTTGPLVIPQELESEMLQHDIDSRPEAPTLDDYAATPIDQFGMALLRGMGWKEGQGAGKGGRGPQAAAEPKKRAALLGLGAKERPAATSSLPSSSSASRKPRSDRRDYKYVPVLKGETPSSSIGRAESSDHRYSDDRSREHSSRDSQRRDRDDRHKSSRDSLRHESSRSSHRRRSRSPPRKDDRDKHREKRRDDRDGDRRSHGSSRSDRDRRHDRDGDRDRDDRRRDQRR